MASADWVARKVIGRPFFYGWLIVLITFTTAMTTAGISGYGLSFFIVPMSEELGISRTQFSAIAVFRLALLPSASLPGIAGGQEARPAAAGHHWQHNRRPGAYVHLPGAGAVAILPHVRRDIRAGYVQHGRSAGRTRRHLQVVHQEARQGHGHWDYGHIDRRLHHRSNGRVVCGRVWMAHGLGLTRHIYDTGHHAHGRSVHAAPAGGHRPLAGRGRARWGRPRQGWLHRVPLDSSRGVQDQSALDNDGRSVPGQHGPHARHLSPGGLHPGQELQPGNRYGGGCDTCLLRHSRKADLGIHCGAYTREMGHSHVRHTGGYLTLFSDHRPGA